MNDPFGETVNWDLIPSFAIGGMQLVPGSNPVYGMNTLGGAISIQTKSGRDFQGAAVDLSAGSWGRKTALVEYGGVSKDKSVDYYIGYQNTDEDGWRKYSPSRLNQLFAKTGWQNETTRIGLTYMGADNKLIGNGLVPKNLLSSDRDEIFTRPDQTDNYYHHLTLNGDHWVSDTTLLSANAYYRKSNRKTLNGDANDDYNEDFTSTSGYAATSLGGHGCHGDSDSRNTTTYPTKTSYRADSNNYGGTYAEECAEGALNRTSTKQDVYGLNLQAAFSDDLWGKKNALTVGTAYEHSKIKFNQTQQLTEVGSDGEIESGFTASRSLQNLSDEVETVHKFSSKTHSFGLFATDTLSLNDQWHLTGGLRYNYFKVDTNDKLNAAGEDDSLSGKHTFNRINPSVGLTFTPTNQLSVYGSYSESNRAPSAIELGCANPLNGCKLPNAMASDPPLDQVVAKTYEVGARGKVTESLGWTASAYQTKNYNDIQFITSDASSGLGYFDNISRTRRRGIDLGLNGKQDAFRWFANYSYVRAQYDSELEMLAEFNSNQTDEVINVKKGDNLPGVPKHQVKFRAQYDVTPAWSVGANLIGYSSQYVRGNENNSHNPDRRGTNNNGDTITGEFQNFDSGKLGGYFIVNLDTQYRIGKGWNVYAKAINIFDKEYETAGAFGFSHFNPQNNNGGFDREGLAHTFVAPGAPRAGWVGVRYEFDAPKE
jgi:outer membrane receptor protein involved in Fe transport